MTRLSLLLAAALPLLPLALAEIQWCEYSAHICGYQLIQDYGNPPPSFPSAPYPIFCTPYPRPQTPDPHDPASSSPDPLIPVLHAHPHMYPSKQRQQTTPLKGPTHPNQLPPEPLNTQTTHSLTHSLTPVAH